MVSVLRLFVVFVGVLVFSPDLFAQFCLNLKRQHTDGTMLYYTNKNPVRHILNGGSKVYPAGTFCVLFTGNSENVIINVIFKENKRGGSCENSRQWGMKQETISCNKVLTTLGGPNVPEFLKDYEVDTGKYYPPPPPTFDEQVMRTIGSTKDLLDQVEGNERSFDLIPQLRKHDEALDSLSEGAKRRLREIGEERKELLAELNALATPFNVFLPDGFSRSEFEIRQGLQDLREEEEKLEMTLDKTAKSADGVAIAMNKAARAKEYFVDPKDAQYFDNLNTQLKEQTRLYNALVKAKEAGASVEERQKIAASLKNEFEIQKQIARFNNTQLNTILNQQGIEPTIHPDNPPEEPKQETACANAVDKCSCSCESTGHNVGCACSCNGQPVQTFISRSD